MTWSYFALFARNSAPTASSKANQSYVFEFELLEQRSQLDGAGGLFEDPIEMNFGRYVRRAALGEEAILREVRLQALSDAPEAFGSTLHKELARSNTDWQGWISLGAVFILHTSQGARGMVAGVRDQTDPAVVHLMAMWVHPDIRGSGGADNLVSAVVAWAESVGAKLVRLKVIEGNDHARRFYQRVGFCPTGIEGVRERDGMIEVEMERGVDVRE